MDKVADEFFNSIIIFRNLKEKNNSFVVTIDSAIGK